MDAVVASMIAAWGRTRISAGRLRVLLPAVFVAAVVSFLQVTAPISGASQPAAVTKVSVWQDQGVRLERVAGHRSLPREGDTEHCLLPGIGRLLGSTEGEDVRLYESSPSEAQQPFNAVGFRVLGALPAGARWEIDARASGDGVHWDEWTAAEQLDAEAGETQDTDLVFLAGRYLQYRLAVYDAGEGWTGSLPGVQVTFIDSSEGPTGDQAEAEGGPLRSLTALIRPNVIGRPAWRADEKYRTWPATYAGVKKIVIHHTATTNAPPDPAAAIRAIYYYHSVTQEWGDIGYNFIIDNAGRVYEGRYGGPGVVGAHASGYNVGSIGISLLGTFTSEGPSEAALKAVEDFIVAKAVQHGIEPGGTGFFVNRNLPNVFGHRDVNSTACPGEQMYGQLPSLRQRAVDGMPALGQSWVQDSTPLVMDAAVQTRVTVAVRNSGRAAWSSAQPNPIRVGFRWYRNDSGAQANDPGLEVRTDLPRAVASGEAVTVDALLRTPSQPGSYVLAWDMVQERGTWFTEQGNQALEKPVVVGRLDSLPNDVIMGLPNEFLTLLPAPRLRSFPLARLTLLSNTELVQRIPDIIPQFPNDRVLSFSNDMLLRYLPDARLKTFSMDRITTFPAEVQQRLGFAMPTATPAVPATPTATPRPVSPTPTPAADPGGATAP